MIQAVSNVPTFPPLLLTGLRKLVFDVMGSRGPDFVIGSPERPYMRRWWLKREEDESHYIHEILRDDDDRALHDHPWPSLSILIDGRLAENYAPEGADPKNPLTHARRLLRAGDIVLRGADFAHRLELDLGRPAVTLFLTGPRIREWGFYCPQGFVHWRDFTATDNPGAVGRGCGEAAA